GSDGLTRDAKLKVTSDVAPNPSAEVTAHMLVGAAYRVVIDPDQAAGVQPGQVYRYSHTMTNTGLLTDTFTLSADSLLGWDVSVAPSSVTLLPGATARVTVTVLVPPGVDAGIEETTIVTARSITQPSKSYDQAADTSTVLQVAGVSISPRWSLVGAAGT